ncbi:MAG TPA: hypothetical protein VGZ22_12090 [Isosphaeraceae bacterium]|nr:hypothetical protein [Isosphaeraceae bacterium]
MPHRFVCVAILLFWAVAAVALFTRDLLPDLLIGTPPDLRSISVAERNEAPTRWTVLVADDPSLLNLRTVGQAVTTSTARPDGSMRLSSEVRIEARGLLEKTPFRTSEDEHLVIKSFCEITPSGNLSNFATRVRSQAEGLELLCLDGRVKGDVLEVKAKGPLPLFNQVMNIPYQSRGMVQNTFGPLDRMPGLQVGQRWKSWIVSPLTGRVEPMRAEVKRKGVITWANNPVPALEVVAKAAPVSVRLWVRPDGLVLRQEVPFPFFRLVLERQPAVAASAAAKGAIP